MAFENLKSNGIAYLLGKLKTHLEGTYMKIANAVRSVNGNAPNEEGDVTITTVPYAQNLESESSTRSSGTFIQRTAGGEASIQNGSAWLMNIKGNNVHDGFVPESLEMTVNAVSDPPITATIDRDTFVEYVSVSGTTTLVYSTGWSEDPTNYGVTVTGTPDAGDTIVINYVREERGTITVANPQSFVATGWNLYNNATGYAKVVGYAYDYGITGSYTALQYSSTLTGARTSITVVDGGFEVPGDGYVWVTGGNSTDTAIYTMWEDWAEEPGEDFALYSENTVDLSSIMAVHFPFGLLKAGTVVDEIDLNLGQSISRVERLEYTDENRAIAEGSGREYEFDENYIYLQRVSAVTNSISISGAVDSNDHGIEFFSDTDVEVTATILYGANLKNKLERDVLTVSQQTLTAAQKNQVLNNIGAASSVALDTMTADMNDMRLLRAKGNYTSYTLTIPDYQVIDAKYALLIGYKGIYYVYVSANGTDVEMYAAWTTIGSYSAVRNSKTSITFNFSSTQWGGVRLLWLE